MTPVFKVYEMYIAMTKVRLTSRLLFYLDLVGAYLFCLNSKFDLLTTLFTVTFEILFCDIASDLQRNTLFRFRPISLRRGV